MDIVLDAESILGISMNNQPIQDLVSGWREIYSFQGIRWPYD